MIDGLVVVDEFLPDPHAVRRHALGSHFTDWHGHDGEVYKRICMTDVPGLRDRLELLVGPVDMLGMAYRLNYAGELPNAIIHSDIGWGTHALVLYLADGESGTAFWHHRPTGTNRLPPGDLDLLAKVEPDWNQSAQWSIREVVETRFNRAAIYDSALYHSRLPFDGFGSHPENGRLIAVAFFTPHRK